MHSKAAVSKMVMALVLGGAMFVGAPVFLSPAVSLLAQDNGSDAQLQQAVQRQLKGKNFSGVTVRVSNGTATLSGQVELYGYKTSAIKKAKKVKGVKDVRDNIAVGGPTIPDNVLAEKLLSRIQVDRVGFGQVFDAIGVSVHNGMVTLGGHAKGPVTEQSAYSLTEYTPGVKGIINQISIDPVSPMDDGIRVATFRAIYGYAPLRQYAIVPSRPIRISVQNGNVTLYGVVNNEMDKTLAYTRAMQVPNVFHVTNNLIVANQPPERKKSK